MLRTYTGSLASILADLQLLALKFPAGTLSEVVAFLNGGCGDGDSHEERSNKKLELHLGYWIGLEESGRLTI